MIGRSSEGRGDSGASAFFGIWGLDEMACRGGRFVRHGRDWWTVLDGIGGGIQYTVWEGEKKARSERKDGGGGEGDGRGQIDGGVLG